MSRMGLLCPCTAVENLVQANPRMLKGDPSAPPPRPRTRARRRPASTTEARQHRRRIVTYALLGIAVVLMVNALVGDNGYLAGLRARREYDQATAEVARLRLENQALEEHARRLRDDPLAIEEAARRDLGLIRPGETLVIVKDR
jgi:cell division protein FtsB